MTSAEHSSRWVRRFVVVGVFFLVGWQVVVLADVSHRPGLVLGLLGFVFHTIFGKAYSLIPTYFDRDLVTSRWLPMHLALTAGGVSLLAVGMAVENTQVETTGALLWAAGVAVFVGTLGWTIRSNQTGSETATGDHDADRRQVDRVANLAVPVALTYLVVGTYELLAISGGLPTLFDGYPPRAIHLLAAGSGALMVFAVGFRLLPRFLVAHPPLALVVVVLPSGAVGPALLAAGLPAGTMFQVGAVLEAVAILGFALTVWVLYRRSDRRRVGFYAVLASTFAGVAGVALGLHFAFATPTSELIAIHRRLNVLGFLGLVVVGVSYQFYPPAIAAFPGGGNRTALVATGALAFGLTVEALGVAGGLDGIVFLGQVGALFGALAHGFVILGLFRQQFG